MLLYQIIDLQAKVHSIQPDITAATLAHRVSYFRYNVLIDIH